MSFTGELQFEVSVPACFGAALWREALSVVGRDLGARPVGMEAWLRLRLEKGYIHVGTDTDGRTVPVDIVTGTFGKALGGALGGYTAASSDVVALLRQRSRPYLFSNSLMPAIVGATLEILNLLEQSGELRTRLRENAEWFRSAMAAHGFKLGGAGHPIVPVMLGEAPLAQAMARALDDEGILVTAFSYPVVPRGAARIRAQMSARHSREQLDRSVAAFARVGRRLGVIG